MNEKGLFTNMHYQCSVGLVHGSSAVLVYSMEHRAKNHALTWENESQWGRGIPTVDS